MHIYEKPLAEIIDFSVERIMNDGGNAGEGFSGMGDGDEAI